MAGRNLRPYPVALVYAIKSVAAAGERVARILALNRFAPRVAGIERRVQYVPDGHRLHSLDIFKPPGEPPFPVLLFMHGSAHHVMDKRTYDRVCKTFAAAGYLVFNANYRMCPRHRFREQWRDAAAAVNWVADNAHWFGGDSAGVFLGGDSAGASLSSAYSVMAQDEGLRREIGVDRCLPVERIRGLLLFYGVFDCQTVQETRFPFTSYIMSGYLSRDQRVLEECAGIASPLRHLRPGFPECYLATSEVDPLHSETLAFKRKLDDLGVPYEYLNLPRREHPFAQHGFLNFWWMRCARLAMRGALDFLERHT